MPSFAPSTAARSQPIRSVRCCSWLLTTILEVSLSRAKRNPGLNRALPKNNFPYCKLPVVTVTSVPMDSPDTTSSTRRFSCRPEKFSLEATGSVLPKPVAVIEFVDTPCCTRLSLTAVVRRNCVGQQLTPLDTRIDVPIIDRCRSEQSQIRSLPATDKGAPDTGTRRESLLPFRASQCRQTVPAVRQARRSTIA